MKLKAPYQVAFIQFIDRFYLITGSLNRIEHGIRRLQHVEKVNNKGRNQNHHKSCAEQLSIYFLHMPSIFSNFHAKCLWRSHFLHAKAKQSDKSHLNSQKKCKTLAFRVQEECGVVPNLTPAWLAPSLVYRMIKKNSHFPIPCPIWLMIFRVWFEFSCNLMWSCWFPLSHWRRTIHREA